MSIYDKASLVLIPSGTKTSKVYSQKPVSGDGDFTFSRSTAATRVNASGNIEKETSNLLLQSNSFDTTWVNSNSTETGGQSGYDGTSDAWQLTASSAGLAYLQQSNTQSGVQTFSVYAKAGTADHLQVYITGTDSSHYFDLTNGTASKPTGAGAVDSSIEDIGSGWYRCSCVCNGTNVTLRLYIRQGLNVNPSAGEYIYIQDAQLEQGLVARDYIETTTAAIYGGITDNVPRLDYTDSSCPALLLEPQRTNGITQSEYSGVYSVQNISLTDNFATSPEGYDNAFKAVPNTTNNQHIFFRSGMGNAADTYTQSIFAKANGYNFCLIRFDLPTKYAFFDLQNGTTAYTDSGVTSTITDMGDGWYRCTATMTTTQYANAVIGVAEAGDSLSDRTFTGDGTKSVLFYGHQSELGSYATSYIPTYGTSVTRNQDNTLNSSAASVIGQTEGAIYAEVDFKAISEESRFVQLSDGTNSNRFLVGSTTTNGVQVYVVSGGAVQWTPATTPYSAGVIKVAVAYKNNDYAMYVNGTQINTSSSASVPAMDEISVGYNSIVGNRPTAYGHRQVMLFKTRLSNEELADLTTL